MDSSVNRNNDALVFYAIIFTGHIANEEPQLFANLCVCLKPSRMSSLFAENSGEVFHKLLNKCLRSTTGEFGNFLTIKVNSTWLDEYIHNKLQSTNFNYESTRICSSK